VGDGLEGEVGGAEQVGRERDPPAGRVGHGGFADQRAEPLREGGPRASGLRREAGDGPGAGRVVVDQPRRRADHPVAVRPVPARGRRLRPGEPGAQRRDERDVQQPLEDGLLGRAVPADSSARNAITGFCTPASRAGTISAGRSAAAR